MNSQVAQPVAGFDPAVLGPYVDPAGLGVRAIGSDTFSCEPLEVLRLTPDLGAPDDVERLVRERATHFKAGASSGLVPLLRIDRAFDGQLAVWSRLPPGVRLSVLLEWSLARNAPPSPNAALIVGDRLLAALAALQALNKTEGASGHGAIAIDQIVISETGALTLTDYAFSTTIAALQWPRDRLWRRFRIAMPPSAGFARFDHRVDVTQSALVICALLAGRPFKAEEYPAHLDAIVAEALDRSCTEAADDRARLASWLRAATELDTRSAFPSAEAARQALRKAVGNRLDDGGAVLEWLRAARGIAEPQKVAPVETPIATQATEPIEVVPAVPEAPAPAFTHTEQLPEEAPSGFVGRLRSWISAR
jgi:hypothetical protein